MTDAGRLAGRTAVITGAARGQGAAEAALFVAEGATVVLADIRADEAGATAAALGERAVATTLDVSDPEGWAAVVALATERFGPPTVLVNNAGILPSGTIETGELAAFRAAFDVNVMGTVLGIRSVAPVMRAAGGGAIVNVSSIAGLRGTRGLGAYTASKFAIRGITQTAALELGHDGIRVNAVLPGPIDTEMVAAFRDPSLLAHRPIPRYGRADEVAQVVLFLASDASSFVTGSDHVVDGGATAGL